MKRIRERGGGGEREREGEGEREEGRGGWVTFFKGINKLSECSCSFSVYYFFTYIFLTLSSLIVFFL